MVCSLVLAAGTALGGGARRRRVPNDVIVPERVMSHPTHTDTLTGPESVKDSPEPELV